MGRIQSLQALRFFAALAVVVDHAMRGGLRTAGGASLIGGKMDFGAAGVDVFFVLSGFIIAKTVLGQPKTAGQFWLDRWWRVAPTYLLLSLPWAWVAWATGAFTWERLAATLTFWPAYGEMTSPFLLVGWSLCFEALFYLAVGLTLIDRRWIKGLPVLFIGAWIARLILDWPVFQFLGNPIIIEFLAGVGLCLWWDGERRPKAGVLAAVVAAALMVIWLAIGPPDILGAVGTMRAEDALIRVFWIGIPAALAVYSALQFKGEWGRLPYLGNASYSLYLVHPLVLLVVHRLPLSWWVEVGIGIVASVIVAILIYEKVERPIMEAKPRPAARASA